MADTSHVQDVLELFEELAFTLTVYLRRYLPYRNAMIWLVPYFMLHVATNSGLRIYIASFPFLLLRQLSKQTIILNELLKFITI